MKKNILYGLAFCMMIIGFTSCNDDEDQVTDSALTYYPVFEMQGDEFTQSPIGDAYHDAGCTATLKGVDCTSQIVTTGIKNIDVNKAGLYKVTYSMVNEDGYTKSVSRTVAVCDPNVTTDISGKYQTQNGTYRDVNGAKTDFKGYTVTITKAAPGIFEVSDIMGGYYDQGRNYGSDYAMYGYFQLFADNTLKCLSGDVAIGGSWPASFSDFVDGKYDPATGAISYVVTYAGMDFHVILNK